MAVNFPDKPGRTTDELGTDCAAAFEQLDRRVRADETIGTTETAVAHGLKGVPRIIAVTPHADARVWRSSKSTPTHIYLTASVSVECDIEVAL